MVLACLLAGLTGRGYGQAPGTEQDLLPTLVPAWAPAPPRIDGRLDDACWRDADTVESFHAVDGGSRHADVARAKVAYGPAHLYIAFQVRAAPSSNPRAGTMQRDAGVWGGNCVQVFIRPLATGSFYVFTVNSANTQRDARDSDVGWDAGWESATLISPAADFWQIELAIPYAAFDLYPSVGPEWRLNLTCVTSVPELTEMQRILTWAPTFGNFHQPDRFGRMLLDRVDWQRWRYNLKASVTPGADDSFAVVVDADSTATEAEPADYDVLVAVTNPAGTVVRHKSQLRLPNPAPPPGAPPKGVARLSLPIAADGRYLFTVGLRHRDENRLVAECKIRAETPPPFEAWLDRSLYTDQRTALLQVRSRRRRPENAPVKIVILDQDGTEVSPVRLLLAAADTPAEISLGIADLPNGRYSVAFFATEGAVQPDLSCRLLKAEPREGTFWYDGRGVMHRDREAILPFGMYYIRSHLREDESLLEEYKQAGFNTVFWEWDGPEGYANALSWMAPHGLNLVLGLQTESGVWSLQDAAARNERVDVVLQQVAATRPTNLLAWMILDEPSVGSVPTVRRWSDSVWAHDPHSLSYVVMCYKEVLRAFAPVTDIVAPDPYPGFPGGPITKVSDFMIEASSAARGHQPVVAVLQAFGARGQNSVLPSAAELRCMTYLSLVHEARGVYYFSYDWNAPLREHYPSQWAELSRLAGELRDRKDILLADGAGLAVTEPTFEGPVHARVMKTDGSIYLLAVNTQRTRFDNIGFHVPGLGSGTLHAVFGDQDLETQEGRFAADFVPLAVHFYRFDEHHAPLSYNIGPVTAPDPVTGRLVPFFPIGWYHFGPMTEQTLDEIHANGANTALFGGLGLNEWQKAATRAGLDHAHRLGMKVVLAMAGTAVGGVVYGKPDTYAILLDYVQSFKDHPAVLGWQLGDELPAGAAPSLNDAATIIRENGARHQIWQVHSHIESDAAVRELMARTDVCTFDGYTYKQGQPVFADVGASRVLAWQRAKADLIAAAGWAGNVNVTQAYGGGVLKMRFPTYEEYRWNVFSAIASAGARGTLNWIYCYWQGFYDDDQQPFFDFRDRIVKRVNSEQQMIRHAMETGYNVGRVRSDLDELTTLEIPPATGSNRKFNKIGHILLRDDRRNEYFLIVTNNESADRDVQLIITDLPVPPASLTIREPHDDNRELRLEALGGGRYRLEDSLGNHDVALYVIPATPK